MKLPIERPTTTTGGTQTASISAAASRAKSAICHGSGSVHVVPPMPRLSKVVLRKCGSKCGICQACQSEPSPPPPATQTMSRPAPNCS
jgi:hypothetical protein